jgi:hypothetical protein
MLFTFVVVPFAYFYYEEDDEDVTIKQRVVGGCKYTSFLIVILVVLIVIGALLKGGKPHNLPFQPADKKNAEQWLGAIFTDQPLLTFIVTFGIASLTVVGFLCVITYTVCFVVYHPTLSLSLDIVHFLLGVWHGCNANRFDARHQERRRGGGKCLFHSQCHQRKGMLLIIVFSILIFYFSTLM